MLDTDLMPFGKHEGKKMGNVPASYLLWFYEKGTGWAKVKHYIRKNLELLQKEKAEADSYRNCNATESDIY